MKKIKLLFIIVAFVFSCKKNINNSKQHKETLESETYIENTVKENTTFNSNLEFFNELGVLGTGLIRVNERNSLTIIKNGKEIVEDIYNPTITPIFFKPDYGIFYLVCVLEKENNYMIQIDKNNTAILPKAEYIEFLSWDRFLLNSTGISNLDWKKNPLKTQHNKKSTVQDVNEEDDFVIIDVQNEWVQISNEQGLKGWIKWKEGNKLLIDVYLLM